MSQPHFGISVRVKPTLPKVGSWNLLRLPKSQSSISGVKSPFIRVFFMSLERSWNVDVQNGFAWAIWTFATQVMGKRRAGNRPLPDVNSRSATWRWKALKEIYNFGLNLVPIRARGEKLWTPKVLKVQTGTVSGLHFGSPGKKSHSDVASAWSCKEYYMGEGGGFPRIQAVVSQVCPSACALSQHPRVVLNVN
jgi:hypothetical protein